MSVDQSIKASIIITTYDRYDLLPEAIDSVLSQEGGPRFEVIVVDNFIHPEAHLELMNRYAGEKRVRILGEIKKGLSNARNSGVTASAGEFCCFIDDDARAHPGWLQGLMRGFDEFGADAAIVGGSVEPKWTSPPPPWITASHLGYLSVVDWGGTLRVAGAREWLAGCNIAFRKSALAAVGGFNASLGRSGNGLVLLSNEESDASTRIVELGKLRIYAPAARVDHVVDPSRLSLRWFRKRVAWQALSDYLMDPERSEVYGSGAAKRVKSLGELQRSGKSDPATDVFSAYDMVMGLLAGADLCGDELD